jgi:hypothetical protein
MQLMTFVRVFTTGIYLVVNARQSSPLGMKLFGVLQMNTLPTVGFSISISILYGCIVLTLDKKLLLYLSVFVLTTTQIKKHCVSCIWAMTGCLTAISCTSKMRLTEGASTNVHTVKHALKAISMKTNHCL